MENRPIFIVTGLLAASLALAQSAYRWTDEDGIVHYSDVPVDGAETLDLSVYSATTGVRLAGRRASAGTAGGEDPAEDEAAAYQSIAIISPAAEETLWNISGVLNVSLAVSPGLKRGHQVRVYFDGVQRLVSGSSFQIEEVHRGVHNLQVEVIDATGRLMIRSQPNRFYVQQNSLIQRNRVNPPSNPNPPSGN